MFPHLKFKLMMNGNITSLVAMLGRCKKNYLVVKRQSRCSWRWYCCCGAGCSSASGRAGRASPASPPPARPGHCWTRSASSFSCAGPAFRAGMGSSSHGWNSATASPPGPFHGGRSSWSWRLWRAPEARWSAHRRSHTANQLSCPRHQPACTAQCKRF